MPSALHPDVDSCGHHNRSHLLAFHHCVSRLDRLAYPNIDQGEASKVPFKNVWPEYQASQVYPERNQGESAVICPFAFIFSNLSYSAINAETTKNAPEGTSRMSRVGVVGVLSIRKGAHCWETLVVNQ